MHDYSVLRPSSTLDPTLSLLFSVFFFADCDKNIHANKMGDEKIKTKKSKRKNQHEKCQTATTTSPAAVEGFDGVGIRARDGRWLPAAQSPDVLQGHGRPARGCVQPSAGRAVAVPGECGRYLPTRYEERGESALSTRNAFVCLLVCVPVCVFMRLFVRLRG